MPAETSPAPAPAAYQARNSDRYSNAGATPDPWVECARLAYGADRSFAWTVREQVLATPPDGYGRLEDKLLKALATSDRTEAGLAFLCQMLALVASAKSVPVLAPLLGAPATAEAARYALERIPGPEADAALRAALGTLAGVPKAGVIGSLAVRGDAAALPALAALRDAATEPAVVREAAARAVEKLTAAKS